MLSRVVLLLVALASVLAGCGSAGPLDPPSPLPPRPAPLALDGAALCSALTADQKRDLGVDRERAHTGTVDGRPSPGCIWGRWDTNESWTVQIIETPAAEALAAPGARAITVAGYGAVREADDAVNYPGGIPFCQIPIDAADGRSLRVQYSSGTAQDGRGGDPAAVDRACARAIGVAEDVLANLRG